MTPPPDLVEWASRGRHKVSPARRDSYEPD
ncbi:hypothetical protein QE320_gp072 [Pseudomonas phage EM]|uniref:Uncharacterized protein n=1 Tax=Pseudomonas phage EM TaxID=2936914 RepID=A0AAE9HM16_9CAUD|nr:hypothetical protein QE320_gp072 [Pseudomonas phage EM]UPW35982.1 hypothetical protein EM_197 [Pseudomonas phage EM]